MAALRRWCSTVAAATSKGTRWERLRDGRAGVWCRSLLRDYKEACREIFVGASERPLKASLYVALFGGAYVCYYTNPDEMSFQSRILETSNQLALLSPWIRSGTSDGHVQSLAKLRNEGRLRYISLGIISLVYMADYDPEPNLYEARCSALSVPWAQLPQRVLDIGFVGRWWLLENKMENYDINEEEFKHLPVALQTTAVPTAQDTERNERLHQESWKALVMEGDEEMDSVKKGEDVVREGNESSAKQNF
ncbi:mitochondrial import inner membrane translocase subunit Tim29 [Clarias gariepinus]|uniref:mitochondrial import inner membrane translocase subunit Tim29 n=1 Tax=Clarias gariepinus TaxID=13013 RepID=UPI00234C1F82|nr:mitochondrial import inner membrane translocase subunit Tim29 [Clarias gariepinus]